MKAQQYTITRTEKKIRLQTTGVVVGREIDLDCCTLDERTAVMFLFKVATMQDVKADNIHIDPKTIAPFDV